MGRVSSHRNTDPHVGLYALGRNREGDSRFCLRLYLSSYTCSCVRGTMGLIFHSMPFHFYSWKIIYVSLINTSNVQDLNDKV
jgi:hypothetical protein